MADDDEKDQKAPAAGAARGGPMGPILALLAVVVLAVVFAWMLVSVFQGDEPEAGATRTDQAGPASGPIWDRWNQIEINEVLANVPGSGGRRYVKISVQLWVDKADFTNLSRPELAPIMREALIDRLRTYNLADLEGKNAHDMLRRAFEQELDKTLRDALGVSDPERRFVQRIVLTDHLVQ